MSEFWDDMLIKAAADEYLKDEYEKTQKEMENVEDIFHEKAAENDKKFKKLLKKEYKKQKRKEVRYPLFYRVATFVAVLLLVFDVCIFTVPAIRKAAVDFINRVTGEYTNILRDEEQEEDVADNDPVPKQDFGYEKEYMITYVPEEMTLTDYAISSMQIIYNYIGNGEDYLYFTQEKSSFATNIDTENAGVITLHINGKDAIMIEKDDQLSIIYDISNYTIKLESKGLSRDTLIDIAKSVREIK